jgi:hypothetical protein
VITKQRVTAAYERLIDRFGTPAEKTALDRGAPLERPAEADLINRAIDKGPVGRDHRVAGRPRTGRT